MSETDPFNDGRILSGRVHVKDVNFTYSVWGRRTMSQDEALDSYDFWMKNLREPKLRRRGALKNLRIDVAWNG